MRFCQIDRIIALDQGRSITAVRGLALNEEYLRDHFPRFPVMPGVVMLEGLYQAAMYFVLAENGFRCSVARLKSANQVKFANFLEPGKQLRLQVDWKKQEDSLIYLSATGTIDDKSALKAKLVLDRYNLAERGLAPVESDDLLRRSRQEEMLKLLDPRGELRQQVAEIMAKPPAIAE